METPATQTVPLNRQTWRRFRRAVSGLTDSEVGGKAKLLFAMLIALLFAINGLNVVNSYVGRDFMTAISERSMRGFISLAIMYVAVFAGSTIVAVLYRFCEERLGVLWRERLTKGLLNSYLEHATSYRLSDRLLANGEIANPDQRIADDVRAFTTTTLSFVLLLLNGTFTVIAFSGVMWSISPRLFIVGVLYAGAGSLLTVFFGHSLVGLNYAQLDKEANFRTDLVGVRENAESVAEARYETLALSRLQQRLDEVVANTRRMIAVNRNLGFFTTGYNYMIQIIPALIVAPLFIRGEVEFGVITQSAMAFSQLLGAFSLIVTQFQSISTFTAVIARLGSLGEALEQAHAMTVFSMEKCHHHRQAVDCPICLKHLASLPHKPTITISESDGTVAYEHLTLRAPQDQRPLVTDLSIVIPLNTRVLILGANEAAKVALFRATAGIWDVGEGHLLRPGAQHIGFLPERPYLPPGTMRQLLTPQPVATPIVESQIRQLATTLGLPALASLKDFDGERDWNDELALGEQQLVAVIRLILAAPQFVFLDRPQTILTPGQVETILAALSDRNITYITVGERNGWHDRYDAELELREDASWSWRSTREEQARA